MSAGGRNRFAAHAALLLFLIITAPGFAERLQVAYAGSMGVVMDRYLGPAFERERSVAYEGIGQGSYGLARLIVSRQIRPDVFISVTPGPMQIVLDGKLAQRAYPIASTEMVITYNPRSRFASAFEAAAAGRTPWYEALERPGVRFGRTDPAIDPQGRNIIFTLLLAERYYDKPGLAARILGDNENPAQIFSEGALLSRLEAGQLDAASGYRSAAQSHGLPFITLPDEINLSDARLAASWYVRASLSIQLPGKGSETVRPEPLVFYAAALTDAANPELAGRFVEFLRSAEARRMLEANGYGEPKGSMLR